MADAAGYRGELHAQLLQAAQRMGRLGQRQLMLHGLGARDLVDRDDAADGVTQTHFYPNRARTCRPTSGSTMSS